MNPTDLPVKDYIAAARHALNPPPGADAEQWLEADAPSILAACVRRGLPVALVTTSGVICDRRGPSRLTSAPHHQP